MSERTYLVVGERELTVPAHTYCSPSTLKLTISSRACVVVAICVTICRNAFSVKTKPHVSIHGKPHIHTGEYQWLLTLAHTSRIHRRHGKVRPSLIIALNGHLHGQTPIEHHSQEIREGHKLAKRCQCSIFAQ